MITNTTLFLLPVFHISEGSLQSNGFKNAYIRDAEHELPEDNLVYALFKPTDNYTFGKLQELLEVKGFLFQDYDYQNGYVVLVLIFPEAFMPDFRLVKQGKYSKTSEEFKQLFPSKQSTKDDESDQGDASFQHRVFYKMDILKHRLEETLGIRVDAMGPDFEYWDGFHDDKETLRITEVMAEEKPENPPPAEMTRTIIKVQ